MIAPLVPITLAFIVGILLEVLFRLPLVILTGCGMLSAAVVLIAGQRVRRGGLALFALWMCLGTMHMAAWKVHPAEHLKELVTEEPQLVRLHALVVSDPALLVQTWRGQASQTQVCLLHLLHRRTDEGWRPVAGIVRATVQSPRGSIAYGDEVVIEGEWSSVPPATNPGQYDWRAALARQHIHALLRARPFHSVAILRCGCGWPWMSAIYSLRHRWERMIQDTFETSRAGLLRSFLLGERVALDDRVQEAFIETGTMHMVVISGFNVGLVALLFEMILRLFGLPWRLRLLVSGIGLIGYCALTGMQPPVVRATIMAWMVLGALWLDRVISWPNTLAAAALAILVMNPTQLFDPGFQLSFGAVVSLLVFSARWAEWCQERLRWLRPAWLRRYLALSLSATSAIWVGLSPVLAWYFHLVSLIAIFANLLVAPLVSVLVSFGTVILVASTVWTPLIHGLAWLLRMSLDLIVWMVCWCQRIPGGHVWVAQPSMLLLIGYYGLLILSVCRRRIHLSASRVMICWLAAATIWAWSGVMHRTWQSRWLRVDVLDVGHGDSLVIRTPQGSTMLVDTGSQEAGRYRLLPFLRHEGITTIDALLLTHTDEDHLGGAIPILQSMHVKRLLTNGALNSTLSARMVYALVATHHVPDSVVSAGLRLMDGSDLTMEVLHPPEGFVPHTAPTSNDNSIVLKLTKGTVSILLTGDLEERGAPWLLQTRTPVQSTVLKVPHHGSSLGAAGLPFFNAVHPQIALLSVGRLHHLPSPDTIHELDATGAHLYSTRTAGAISLQTDGVHLQFRTFKNPANIVIIPEHS